MTEIASDLKTSKSTVSRTIQRYRETGQYGTLYQNCGRTSVFDERGKRHLKSLCLKNPRGTASQIQCDLGAAGECDISTMRRHLRQEGCKTVTPVSCPFMNRTQKEKRLNWAKAHQHLTVDDWKKVMFSDETILQILDNCPQFVRVVDGHPKTSEHMKKSTKHPVSVMMWACFSYHGTGRAHVVEGRMNISYYCEKIIDDYVVAQLHEWFPQNDGIFQQDNAPCHVSMQSCQGPSAQKANNFAGLATFFTGHQSDRKSLGDCEKPWTCTYQPK